MRAASRGGLRQVSAADSRRTCQCAQRAQGASVCSCSLPGEQLGLRRKSQAPSPGRSQTARILILVRLLGEPGLLEPDCMRGEATRALFPSRCVMADEAGLELVISYAERLYEGPSPGPPLPKKAGDSDSPEQSRAR
jgi:hypothetical protein